MAETVSATELAKKQREISVAEFFEKNRHLLGFDNKKKALLTAVKEAVDNSLDACEEANILPDIIVEITDMGNDRFRVVVEDNGPGIVKQQIPKVFAKLLYGSKFHSLKQSRGQQGIGISATVMYAQLTTGRPAKILSKIDKDQPAHYYELKIDTEKNMPLILVEETREWQKEHGIRIELDLEGFYNKGPQSVDEYIKQVAIINPHVTITYQPPKGEQIMMVRATEEKPIQAKAIRPHPYGIELGILMKMLHNTKSRNLKTFLTEEFSRIGPGTAKEILENAALLPETKPSHVSREMAEKLMEGIKKTKIMSPPTDCIVPIGEELLEKGLKKEVNAEFYCSVSRTPDVYRGNPFIIECAIAYGGELPKDKTVDILRFANRVPLLYQQGACAITECIESTNWKPYGLNQSGSTLPVGPILILVHMASVWVPFTSEAKEAIAHYPEIIKEIKLALQEAGRKLQKYTAKKRRVGDELKKRSYIEKYIDHVAIGLQELLGLSQKEAEKVQVLLREYLEKHRGKLEDLDFDPDKNVEFDEELARGREEEEQNESP